MQRNYHHGDLARALVAEAVELARAGGPDGVVLRDVTRRVGVSPTAAYRHFADREALLAEVGHRARERLADAMAAGMAAVPARPGGRVRAATRLTATGRAYVRFALAEPGLFRTAFAGAPPPGARVDDRAWAVLSGAVDDLARSGALPPDRRPGAEVAAWAAVHGLAVLLLDGALRDVVVDGGSGPLVDRTLRMVIEGL